MEKREFFLQSKKGMQNQATAMENFWHWPQRREYRPGALRFETVEILLHGGIVNTEELVGGSHHVDSIGLSLGSLFIHKQVHRLVHWGVLEIHTHDQEQGSSQCG